jgi:hypothetical protein
VVFFDACVLSAAARGDHPGQTSAISCLLGAAAAGAIRAVASSRVREELDRIPVQYRAAHLAVFDKLQQFAKSEVTWLDQRVQPASVVTEGRYAALAPILSGVTDPGLVVDALDAGAQYWVTLDDSTVLSRRSEVERLVPIKLLDPSASVERLSLSSYG